MNVERWLLGSARLVVTQEIAGTTPDRRILGSSYGLAHPFAHWGVTAWTATKSDNRLVTILGRLLTHRRDAYCQLSANFSGVGK